MKLQFNPYYGRSFFLFVPALCFTVGNSHRSFISQANSSIFVQSHTADFINCTTSASVTTSAPTQHRKVESGGRWEHGTLIEPLQIHLPASHSSIKTEKNHSGGSTSSTSSSSSKTPSSTSKRGPKAAKGNKNINECILSLHQQHQNKTETKVEPYGTGCSRTLPLTWNQALQQLQNNIHVNTSCASSYANCSPADTTHTTATLLQIKREPCQVSEVTTSNNLIATTSFSGTPAIIKIEQKSPTTTSSSTLASITSSMDSSNTNCGQQNNGKFKEKGCQISFSLPLLIVILFLLPLRRLLGKKSCLHSRCSDPNWHCRRPTAFTRNNKPKPSPAASKGPEPLWLGTGRSG